MVCKDGSEFTGPIEFVYALGAKLAIAGTIRGDRREIAVLQIRFDGQPLFSTSLTPNAPRQEMPYSLVVDSVEVLYEGAVLQLTPPTESALGSILLDANITTDKGKQRFRGNVSYWPLSSSVE